MEISVVMISVFPSEIKSWGDNSGKIDNLGKFFSQNNKYCLFFWPSWGIEPSIFWESYRAAVIPKL
jgi:hypothetical protein